MVIIIVLGLKGMMYVLPLMNQIQIRLLINVFCPSALYVEGIQILKISATMGHMIDVFACLSRENKFIKAWIKSNEVYF